jgi:alpha-L-fucosidase 2
MPHYDAYEGLPDGVLAFRQILPHAIKEKYIAGENDVKDKAFCLSVKVNTALTKKMRINWSGNDEPMAQLEAALEPASTFWASVSLDEGLNSEVIKAGLANTEQLSPVNFAKVFAVNQNIWKSYWAKSAVKLDDAFLERLWYRNLYFLNCAAKDGITCPGLFANWSYNNIGTAWHGDYHMNYNTQQPFWVTFASNHLEKNLPYVDLIEKLMPVSRKWANDYYELPGAYFPHSAFPVEMTMNPYPIPDWGWEVSETPWAVQGLWWHYLYSGDTDFLSKRAYEPIKASVQFLTAYMKRPDAHGGDRWQDDKYHVFPTVPPELYGLRPGFKYNNDCNVDLTLIKFVFKAFKKQQKY